MGGIQTSLYAAHAIKTERKFSVLLVVHQAVGRILIDGRIVLLDGETAVAADFDEERLRHIALGIAHAGAEGQYSVGIARWCCIGVNLMACPLF